MQGEFSIPNFYEYLETQKGKGVVLSDAEVAVLKKEYHRYRNRLYKQRQRAKNHEVILFLNREEHKTLKDAALQHSLIPAHYIKQAALKYTTSTYITPHAGILSQLLSELQKTNKEIDAIAKRKKGFFERDADYASLQTLITTMQNGLINSIIQPVNAEQWILNEIEQNPAFKRKLLTLLLSSL